MSKLTVFVLYVCLDILMYVAPPIIIYSITDATTYAVLLFIMTIINPALIGIVTLGNRYYGAVNYEREKIFYIYTVILAASAYVTTLLMIYNMQMAMYTTIACDQLDSMFQNITDIDMTTVYAACDSQIVIYYLTMFVLLMYSFVVNMHKYQKIQKYLMPKVEVVLEADV